METPDSSRPLTREAVSPSESPAPDSSTRPTCAAAATLLELGGVLEWGLIALGIVLGMARAIAWADARVFVATTTVRAVLDVLAMTLAFGLAGRASALACRALAADRAARMERRVRAGEDRQAMESRAIAAIERLAEAIGRVPVREPAAVQGERERSDVQAEIDAALGALRFDEAEALIARWEAQEPSEPGATAMRDRLDAARRGWAQGQLAQIDAARRVNDADRVLDLFRTLHTSLEAMRRDELERDLARWFLELIQRRLRGGRIQLEVVQLATQAAETFAATVEGASLRASLPVLRRCVGLCPKCAQPYRGTAAVCPRCQAEGTVPPAAAPAASPEGDDGLDEEPPTDERDSGWARWDEDAGNDGVAPA